MASCSSCGAEVRWATMRQSGSPMPVDVARVEPQDVAEKVVAVRNRDRLGVVLDAAAALKVRAAPASWSEWSFFRSHFDTCPDGREHRREVHPGQGKLL